MSKMKKKSNGWTEICIVDLWMKTLPNEIFGKLAQSVSSVSE